MNSNFLKEAAAAAKSVEHARRDRAKAESAAQARFARAEDTYRQALASRDQALHAALLSEAGAWSEMIERLGVPVDVAAQIAGVDPAHVKSVLSAAERPPK